MCGAAASNWDALRADSAVNQANKNLASFKYYEQLNKLKLFAHHFNWSSYASLYCFIFLDLTIDHLGKSKESVAPCISLVLYLKLFPVEKIKLTRFFDSLLSGIVNAGYFLPEETIFRVFPINSRTFSCRLFQLNLMTA